MLRQQRSIILDTFNKVDREIEVKQQCKKIDRANQKGDSTGRDEAVAELTSYACSNPQAIHEIFSLIGDCDLGEGAVDVLSAYGPTALDRVESLVELCDRSPNAMFPALAKICHDEPVRLLTICREVLNRHPSHWQAVGRALAELLKDTRADLPALDDWLNDDNDSIRAASVLARGLTCNPGSDLNDLLIEADRIGSPPELHAAAMVIMNDSPRFDTVNRLLEISRQCADSLAVIAVGMKDVAWRDELLPELMTWLKGESAEDACIATRILGHLAMMVPSLPRETGLVHLLMCARHRFSGRDASSMATKAAVNEALYRIDPKVYHRSSSTS